MLYLIAAAVSTGETPIFAAAGGTVEITSSATEATISGVKSTELI
jgi:hypothetical protein